MSALQQLQQGTYNPKSGQLLWWSYYDRAILANATLQHTFFIIPVGQGGKTRADTNFPTAGSIPQGFNFEVHGIEVYYTPDEIRTQAEYDLILEMMRDTYLQLIVEGKSPQLELTLTQLFGSPFPVNVTGAAAGDYIGMRSMAKGCFELPVIIPLAAETNFRVEMTHTVAVNAGLDGDEILLSLVGNLVTLS